MSREEHAASLREHIQALQAGAADHECGECEAHANEAMRLLTEEEYTRRVFESHVGPTAGASDA